MTTTPMLSQRRDLPELAHTAILPSRYTVGTQGGLRVCRQGDLLKVRKQRIKEALDVADCL